MYFFDNNKTAKLKVKNLAQTTFRLSPVSFHAPHWGGLGGLEVNA
jgi:hypothetical protein